MSQVLGLTRERLRLLSHRIKIANLCPVDDSRQIMGFRIFIQKSFYKII